MNQDQLTAFLRGLLKFAGGFLLAHGASHAANIVAVLNPEDVAGVVVGVSGFVLSHIKHKVPTPPPTTTSTSTTKP